MSPKAKQIFYGLFYFLIFALLVFLIARPPLKKAPTCFDGIQNGGEEGVDCGGPCIPCYLKTAKPLSLSGTPLIFKDVADGKLFALVNIQNLNENVGAHTFYYTADFYDQNNNLVGEVNDANNIFPQESKYIIIKYSGTAYDVGRITQVKVSFNNVSWAKSIEFLKPNVVLTLGPQVSLENNYVIISGTITNQSIFNAPSLDIIGILEDKYGNPLFVGETISSPLQSNASYDFSIFIPQNLISPNYLEKMKAQIFLSVKE